MSIKRRWSAEEVKYLEQAWGKVSIPRIAKRLNRTLRALRHKAYVLGLGGYSNATDLINFSCLMGCFGIDGRQPRCKARFRKLGLTIYEKLISKRRMFFVSIPEFWEWAKDHRDELNFYKLEPLVLGVEPEWVAEQRKMDYYGKQKGNRRWSASEDSMLKYLIDRGCTVKTVAQRLNRAEGAIYRRCYDLGIFNPARESVNKWSASDKAQLVEMWQAGYPMKIIGERLGRSASCCRAKLQYMERIGVYA